MSEHLYVRTDAPPAVSVRATEDHIQLFIPVTHRRRWWQLWKPRTWVVSTIVAEKPHPMENGDTVRLTSSGDGYVVLVNEDPDPVLEWYPRPRGYGFGVRG